MATAAPPEGALRPIDLLVDADQLLTMADGDDAPLAGAAVAIDHGRILDVGPGDVLRARYRPSTIIGGRDRLVLPGLVNAHQHLTGDRLIRSMIPDDLESGRAIFDWAVPAHRAHRPDDDEVSATLGLVEAVGNGITFTVEAGTVAHPDRVLAAYEAVGVAGTLGSWGWDVAGEPWAGSVAEVLDRQREMLSIAADHPHVRPWVTLVGHDLMSDELAIAASELARAHRTGLTFHLSPTDSDPASYCSRTGERPVVHLERLGVLGRHVLIAHAVHVDDAEVDALVRSGTAVAACPWAYLRLGQGVTRAGRHLDLWRRGGRLALGCDAENAGDAVDVLGAARLLAGLSKDVSGDPAAMRAHDVLRLATIDGARAIGLGAEIGSIEAGKRADLVVIDTSRPEWTPRSPDPVLQLVWASDGRAVHDVIAGGRVVVRDGRCTTVDHDALRQLAAEHHARLVRDAGLGRPPQV